MKTDDRNLLVETTKTGVSSAEYASEPRSFVKRLADQMAIDIDELTLQRLSDRIKLGGSREEIIGNLKNIQGAGRPVEKEAAALAFARSGQAGAALIVENITSFAPNNNRAFVLYAYSQVLNRHPGDVELARLSHYLESQTVSRLDILKTLDSKSIEEGHAIIWDSAVVRLTSESSGNEGSAGLLRRGTGSHTLSQDSSETLSLCRYADGKWDLAPTMVPRIDEIRSDSWLVSDGFILTGPKSHLSAGKWLLDLDIVQPEWASVVVDVVANLAVDRLFHVTAHGNLRGSFVFEKLSTHAFLDVRLRISDAKAAQWISIQSLRLRKLDY